MTKAHMKRLLAPKVLHPRPLRQQQPTPRAEPSAFIQRSSHPAAVLVSQGPGLSRGLTPTHTPAAAAMATSSPLLALGDQAPDDQLLLEHSFFAAGLSEDSLRDISERERERERDDAELHMSSSPAQKVMVALAVCAGMALAAGLAGQHLGRKSNGVDPGSPAGTPATVPSPPVPPRLPPASEAPAGPLVAAAVAPAVDEGVAAQDLTDKQEIAEEEAVAAEAALVPESAETPEVADVAPPTVKAQSTVRRRPAITVRDLRAQVAVALAPGAPLDQQLGLAAPAAGAVEGDPQEACAQRLRHGSFSEIRSACSLAFEVQPDAQLAGDVARAALDQRRTRDAAAWARKAIALDARFAEAFVYLGAAESELGHRSAARQAYGRYLELEPKGEQAENVRAIIENL